MTRDELILNNLGLVGSCASRFIGKGIDYEDLYSSGCVGLIKAADGFDESLGLLFRPMPYRQFWAKSVGYSVTVVQLKSAVVSKKRLENCNLSKKN